MKIFKFNLGYLKGLYAKIFHSIRIKLTIFFFIPVVFMIILGYAAYARSSKAIFETFSEATITTITKTGDYYGVILQNVEDKALQLVNDSLTKSYYTGDYSDDVLEEADIFKTIRNNVLTMANTDKYIDNITIIANHGQPVISYGSFDADVKPYEDFVASEEGKLADAKTKTNLWTGYHEYMDDKLTIDQNKYAISLTRHFLNYSAKSIGYVVMDISMNAITDTIKTLDLPESSVVAFISPDGREIIADGDNADKIFAGRDFYTKALGKEEASVMIPYPITVRITCSSIQKLEIPA